MDHTPQDSIGTKHSLVRSMSTVANGKEAVVSVNIKKKWDFLPTGESHVATE
jgi:hypothetical protein